LKTFHQLFYSILNEKYTPDKISKDMVKPKDFLIILVSDKNSNRTSIQVYNMKNKDNYKKSIQ